MKILSPVYLIFLPVVFLCFWFVFKKREKGFAYHSRAQVIGRLAGQSSFYRMETYLFLAAILFAFLALLRPAKGTVRKKEVKNARDIFLDIDTSLSMRTVDIRPDRITSAKKNAAAFAEKRVHDRVGLVVFGGVAYIHCPLTFDKSSVIRLIDEISAGMTQADGTAIGDGLAVAIRHLAKSRAKSKIIVLLTDGANNRGVITPEMAGELAKNLGIKIYAIGVGKTGKALYPVDDPVFGRRYIPIKDELNEGLLMKLSRTTGGKYFRATSSKSLADIYSQIDKLETTKMLSSSYVEWREFQPLLVKLAFLFFISGILFRFVFLRSLP
ncbi:MAG: VWA domain-containing protein [Elusimicrobia bacterium]|nr:VWA domain-containing protein [Elusimicrobiota bacterium]